MNLQKLRGEIVAQYKTQNNFSQAINWHKNKVSSMMTGKYKPCLLYTSWPGPKYILLLFQKLRNKAFFDKIK